MWSFFECIVEIFTSVREDRGDSRYNARSETRYLTCLLYEVNMACPESYYQSRLFVSDSNRTDQKDGDSALRGHLNGAPW